MRPTVEYKCKTCTFTGNYAKGNDTAMHFLLCTGFLPLTLAKAPQAIIPVHLLMRCGFEVAL
jgi:hypothetical protein